MWELIQNLILLSITGIVSFIGLLYLYYQYSFNYWKKLGVPHPKPSFPMGNMPLNFAKFIGQSIGEIYMDMKAKGHTYCGYYLFGSPIFMPISLEMNKHFLVTDFNCFHDRGFHYDEINDPMGASIVTYSGDKWKRIREKMSPTLTVQKTKMMLPIVKRCTHELELLIDDFVKTDAPIPIQDVIKRYTVDVICECAFGVQGNSIKNPNADFVRHAKMIFTTSIKDNMRVAIGQSAPFISKMFKIQLFNPTASEFFRKVVHETVQYREENNVEREDFINLLIRMKNNKSIDDNNVNNNNAKKTTTKIDEDLTIDKIASECFLFFIAGFETTSATLTFALYELACNQKIQDKLRKEVTDVYKKLNGELSYEALTDMPYLDIIIKETLRKYPTVHMLNRVVSKDFKIPGTNIVVEKGTKAVLSTMGLHRDPEYFPDPDKFDPERFSNENKDKIPTFAYLPFGDGPRMCPGIRFGLMETKLCLSVIINKFKMFPHPKTELPAKICSMGNVIGTVNPILLQAQRV